MGISPFTFRPIACQGKFEYLKKLADERRNMKSDKGIGDMVHRVFGILSLLLALFLMMGCGSSTPTVADIGDESLTLEQFENKYAKYNGGWEKSSAATMEEKESFLDLLVKFELKVKEARARGLHQDSSIQAELSTYRETIASTFIVEKDLIEPALKGMYEHRRIEVRASHILFRAAEDALPEDTLEVYSRAVEVIAKVRPDNFDSLAVAFSEDPTVAQNNGDLGFFTGGRMVPQFEETAYQLPVGSHTTAPVRTRFGYHIIKVTAKGESKGSVQISHILKRFSADQADSLAVRDTVEQIYEALRNGIEFEKAAAQYSDDPSSKMRGGAIGAYDRTRLPLDIADLLYSTPVDSVTAPVRQPYGYHIFKVTGFSGVPPFDQIERDLRQQYQQTLYGREYEQYLHMLKGKYNLMYNVTIMYMFTHAFDTTATASTDGWSDTLSSELLDEVLLSYAGKSVTVREATQQIESSDEFRARLLTVTNIEDMVERMSNVKLLDEHVRNVPDRFPQFAEIMQEYEDGILLYRIEQDEIWGKISPTDSALQEYFEQTQENYRWPRRVRFAEIAVRSDSLAKALYERAVAGEDFGELAEQYTEREEYRKTKGEWPLQSFRANQLAGMVISMANDSIALPVLFQGKWSIVKGLGRDTARAKTFEEALPEVRSAYQDYASKRREQEWIEELKAQYDVVIRRETLEDAFKKPQGDS
jgi:peptidyl-prolyl cis-trans isomerase SurA